MSNKCQAFRIYREEESQDPKSSGDRKKKVIKYVTKEVWLVMGAMNDIEQGDVIEMSKGKELF